MELEIQAVENSYCREFQRRSRQQHYLRYFNGMDEKSQRALHQIYQAALNTEGGAQHVIRAMTSALEYSSIHRLARENIALRSAMVWAKAAMQPEKAERIAEMLEDFHVALDAYMQNLSLAEAVVWREKVAASRKNCARFPSGISIVPDWDLEELGLFKAQIRPVLRKLRMKQRQASG